MLNLFKKTTFDKKYPLLDTYIYDDVTRNNLMCNETFDTKYNSCLISIRTLIADLEKHCTIIHGKDEIPDREHIRNIIVDIIIKNDEQTIKSFTEAYLNSDSYTKAHRSILTFYKETANFGKKCLAYAEKNGIISDRTRKNLPDIVDLEYTNSKFIELASNLELDKKSLTDFELDLSVKKYLINIIVSGSYEYFVDIYDRMNMSLNNLVYMLNRCGINELIINKNVYDNLTEVPFLYLILTLIHANNKLISESIVFLIDESQYNKLSEFINNENIEFLGDFSKEELITLSAEELQKKFKKKGKKSKKED